MKTSLRAVLYLLLGAGFFMNPMLADAAGKTSTNWAGYLAQGGTYTAIGGTWVIPVPNASSNNPSTDATWIGIGGVTARDLIQSGTAANVQNGRITYQAWYELLPSTQVQTVPLAVHGGDSVTVSLTQTSSSVWHLSFKDNTTGGDYEKDIQYASSLSSAEWIEEMPATQTPGGGSSLLTLDNFGSVKFTSSYTIDSGVRKTIQGAGAQSITMASNPGTTLATTNMLADDSFTVTRSSAQSSQTAGPSMPEQQWQQPMPQQWQQPMPQQMPQQMPQPMQQQWQQPMPQQMPQQWQQQMPQQWQQQMPQQWQQQMPQPMQQQMPPQLANLTHRGRHGHGYGYGFGGGYGNYPGQYFVYMTLQ